MTSVLFLGSQDFFVSENSNGRKVLCNNLKGISLVMFHADVTQCEYCEEALPEFKKMPYKIPGIKFATVNINKNRDIVYMASQTVLPIKVVPLIILYVNGRPSLKYDGEKTATDITAFLDEILNRFAQQKEFKDNKNLRLESEIPPYTVGVPFNLVCDNEKGICYLTYDAAYHKK